VFVGHAVNHDDNVYRQFNPKTKGIIKSRDVVWLNKSYDPGLNQRMIQVIMMIQTVKLTI
jgi:hypothetical protein